MHTSVVNQSRKLSLLPVPVSLIAVVEALVGVPWFRWMSLMWLSLVFGFVFGSIHWAHENDVVAPMGTVSDWILLIVAPFLLGFGAAVHADIGALTIRLAVLYGTGIGAVLFVPARFVWRRLPYSL